MRRYNPFTLILSVPHSEVTTTQKKSEVQKDSSSIRVREVALPNTSSGQSTKRATPAAEDVPSKRCRRPGPASKTGRDLSRSSSADSRWEAIRGITYTVILVNNVDLTSVSPIYVTLAESKLIYISSFGLKSDQILGSKKNRLWIAMPSLFKVVGPRQNNQTKFSHAEFHFFKTVANSTKLHNICR